MVYRCAHCLEPLAIENGVVDRCARHPDGSVEWSADQVEWSQANAVQDSE